MGHSQRVRLRDMRDVYRLIGECREVGRDAVRWNRRLAEGACRLMGAAFGATGEAHWTGVPRALQRVWGPIEHGGLDERARLQYLQYTSQNLNEPDPIYENLARARGTLVTRSRGQLLDDRRWYASEYCEGYRRVTGCDDFMCSLHALKGPGSVSMITISRAVGDHPFGTRDRRLLHILHCELGELIAAGVLTRGVDGCARTDGGHLSPRMAQTLERLMDGDSEKQVALRLGLSRPTVHQYITALYRHFRVCSRGELMALWVRGGQSDWQSRRTPPGP